MSDLDPLFQHLINACMKLYRVFLCFLLLAFLAGCDHSDPPEQKPAPSLAEAKKALSEARAKGDEKTLLSNLKTTAILYQRKHHYDSAAALYEEALPISRREDGKTAYAELLARARDEP